MSEPCRNPLSSFQLEGGTKREFCDDRCRLIHLIMKKAAKLLAPLEQSRSWEILLKLSRES
jgi:hypothetical protein